MRATERKELKTIRKMAGDWWGIALEALTNQRLVRVVHLLLIEVQVMSEKKKLLSRSLNQVKRRLDDKGLSYYTLYPEGLDELERTFLEQTDIQFAENRPEWFFAISLSWNVNPHNHGSFIRSNSK